MEVLGEVMETTLGGDIEPGFPLLLLLTFLDGVVMEKSSPKSSSAESLGIETLTSDASFGSDSKVVDCIGLVIAIADDWTDGGSGSIGEGGVSIALD